MGLCAFGPEHTGLFPEVVVHPVPQQSLSQILSVPLSIFSENVHTGVNFVDKIESCAMVRFIRLTFVRPKEKNNIEGRGYNPPSALSYKTFIPCAVKVGMCTGAPEYENFSSSWDRARVWLRLVGKLNSDLLFPMKVQNAGSLCLCDLRYSFALVWRLIFTLRRILSLATNYQIQCVFPTES